MKIHFFSSTDCNVERHLLVSILHCWNHSSGVTTAVNSCRTDPTRTIQFQSKLPYCVLNGGACCLYLCIASKIGLKASWVSSVTYILFGLHCCLLFGLFELFSFRFNVQHTLCALSVPLGTDEVKTSGNVCQCAVYVTKYDRATSNI